MQSLLEAVTALASARALGEVTGIVRDSARSLTGSDGVTFVLREGDKCFYAEEEAIAPLWKGSRFDMERCISGWTMLNRQSAVIPDVLKDPRIPQDVYRPTFVRSLMMVPVRQEDPIAAIGAYWAQRHEPTHEQQEVLQALANAAALALRNIELNNELERSVERERLARAQAEAASKLKDEFLSTLSHELRTPLHVVQNWIWQLTRDEQTDPVRKALDVIERNVNLQSRLVEDLLDVSRAVAGKLKLESRPVDLGDACASVLETLRPAMLEKNIKLQVHCEATPPVWGDPDRIRQILLNVLNNAVKFTPLDGSIAIRVSHAEPLVQVSVADSGVGVDAEFLPFMFERFRHADPTLTRRFGGLGIGLTIVKELVQLHGGSVRASSPGAGRGTTVTLELPTLQGQGLPPVPITAAGGVSS